MKRHIVFFILILTLFTNWSFGQNTIEAKDKVLVMAFESAYVKARKVQIYLPKEYEENPSKHFPVLYMQDGQNLFDPQTAYKGRAWELDKSSRNAIKNNEISPCIIVGISNVDTRFFEYFPQKATVYLTKDDYVLMEQGGLEQASDTSNYLADNYLKFLVNELKPFIDKNYRTKTEAASTAIGGSSSGALISLYAICEYPQIFGQAACISTHWSVLFDNEFISPSESIRTYLKHKLPDPKTHRIYFDHGTLAIDRFYEVHQIKVDQLMLEKGYIKGKNWETLKFEGATHSEDSWKKRSNVFLQFLFKA
jgi:predicted alpha/beta superfamily hydrolase